MLPTRPVNPPLTLCSCSDRLIGIFLSRTLVAVKGWSFTTKYSRCAAFSLRLRRRGSPNMVCSMLPRMADSASPRELPNTGRGLLARHRGRAGTPRSRQSPARDRARLTASCRAVLTVGPRRIPAAGAMHRHSPRSGPVPPARHRPARVWFGRRCQQIKGLPRFPQAALGKPPLVQRKALHQVAVQGARDPSPEAPAAPDIDAIVDRNDDVEIVVLQPAPALGANCQEFLCGCRCPQLSAGKHVAQVHQHVLSQKEYRSVTRRPWLRMRAHVGARSSAIGSRLPSRHITPPSPLPV